MARVGTLNFEQLAPAWRWVIAAVLLAMLTGALHGGNLQMGWRHDDPAHLRFVGTYAPWQYFGVPEVMREQSYAHITPWNALFYAIGLKPFGLDARGHHAHLLAVIWLTAWATWGMLRLWIGDRAAFVGAALFLVMPPTGAMAQLLMTGHYAYGLLWTALALGCWSHATQQGRMRYAWATAFFYALACLCKELYVPLPAVLLFWPALVWRERFRLLLPVFAVAVIYAAFRLWLLGGVGGYARFADVSAVGQVEFLGAVGRLVGGVIHMVFGVGSTGWLALVLALACLSVGLLRGWRPPVLMMGATFVALLLPIAPVLLAISQGGIAGRFLVLVAWVLCVALAFAMHHAGRWGAWLVLLLVLVLAVNQQQQGRLIDAASRSGQFENQFMLQGPASGHLVPLDFAQTGYLGSIGEARLRILGEPAPTLVRDEEQLSRLGPALGRAAWAWQSGCGCLRQLGEEWDARAQAFERGVALAQMSRSTMAVEFSLRTEGRLKRFLWRVEGPEGRFFIEIPELGRLPASREGQLPFGADTTLRLGDEIGVRAVIETREGALLRSPLLVLPTTDNHRVTWHRVP